MIALVTTVFTASLLGSLHCAGMCGPFVAFAIGQPENSSTQARLQLAYNGGRLVTYVLLGAAAGAAGGLLDLTASLAGLQPIAMALAGCMIVGFGLMELLRYFGKHIGTLRPPQLLVKSVQRGQRLAMRLQPTQRALTIGLLTTLLPCGWLYAFAITAAGTGDAITGAIVMAIFWSGTLPVLISVGAGARLALGIVGKQLPALCGVALVIVGIFTLVGRSHLSPPVLAESLSPTVSGNVTIEVPDPSELPACCRELDQHAESE